jgi:hypothetical protein
MNGLQEKIMTKKELLELLKDVPDDGLIVVNDGHGGYEDPSEIMAIDVICEPPNCGWGKYEATRLFSIPELEKAEIIKAYLIG